MEIPADEALREIGRFVEDTIDLVRAWQGQTCSSHAVPGEAVVFEKAFCAFDPTSHDGGGAVLGVGRALAELAGDGFAVGEDAAGVGSGGTRIGAEKDVADGSRHIEEGGTWRANGRWSSRMRVGALVFCGSLLLLANATPPEVRK